MAGPHLVNQNLPFLTLLLDFDSATLSRHLQAVFSFISEVGKTPVSSVAQIKDGVVLCKLVNTIRPDTVKAINESGQKFKLAELVAL